MTEIVILIMTLLLSLLVAYWIFLLGKVKKD